MQSPRPARQLTILIGAGINCCVKSIVEGPFTLIYIYAGELYPSTHRGSAVAFCNSFGRIAAMAAPVVLMHAFKFGGGAQQPERGVLCVYSLLAGFAFMGLLSAALFTRETLGKALAVRTKDIDAAEDEPLLHSVSSHAISFVEQQGKHLEQAARQSSQHLQSHLDSLTPKP